MQGDLWRGFEETSIVVSLGDGGKRDRERVYGRFLGVDVEQAVGRDMDGARLVLRRLLRTGDVGHRNDTNGGTYPS